MVKRILIACIAVLLIGYIGIVSYQRYHANQRLNNGEITSQDLRGGGTATTGDEDGTQPELNSATPRRSQAASAPPATATDTGGMTAPATDSITPNPANGMAFAGTGRFQVYRQGNLTWRVNTDNGSTCILFATNEEWRKPVVYSHGCGNS